MTVPRLPMELWAHIATFIPFDELMTTFWALRRSQFLPVTNTHAVNAFLQFSSEVNEHQTSEFSLSESPSSFCMRRSKSATYAFTEFL